jgi:glycosyltransferase involved in cell wall biosynthesis
MIGPFPSDPERIEGGVQASLYGLGVSLLGDPAVASLEVVATPMRPEPTMHSARVGGIDVTFLDTPGRYLVTAVLRLPRVLARIASRPAPVVHIHGTGIVQAGVLLACRLRRLPVVWTMHGITEKEMREALKRTGGLKARLRLALYAGCERLQLRLSPEIIVDTGYVAREVGRRAGTPPQPIPQGIFPEELAATLNPDRRAPLVITLGVIHPRKGHALTLRAFAEVARTRPDARLLVVGALAEPSHLDELRALVAELGLETRVEIRVNEPRDRVLAALHDARVFALHSQEESQGIALCEAMAAGLPIVATRVGDIPDVIGASGAGLLVEYGDNAAMAAHLGRLLDDDALHARLAAAALARAEDFSWRTIATRVLAVYRAARARVRP